MASVLASLGLGVMLGRLIEGSGFSLHRLLAWWRPAIGSDGLRAYGLALAIAWLFMSIAEPFLLNARIAVPPVGLPATIVSGIVAGGAVGLLSGGPLSFALQAAGTKVPAIIVFSSWCAGVIIGAGGVFAPAVELLQKAGPQDIRLADLFNLPAWVFASASAVTVLFLLLRAPVRVRIGAMEWPKLGTGLGFLLCGGWLLGIWGGDPEGLNAVRAIREIWDGLAGGRLWLQPSLLVGVGLGAWGLVGAFRRKDFFGGSIRSAGELVFLVLAGLLLGLACALAGADPAARLFFSVSSLNAGGILFALSFWLGARLGGALETKGGK